MSGFGKTSFGSGKTSTIPLLSGREGPDADGMTYRRIVPSRRLAPGIAALALLATLCSGCGRTTGDRPAQPPEPSPTISLAGSAQSPATAGASPAATASDTGTQIRRQASSALQSALSAAAADASTSSRSLASASAQSEGNPVP